MKIKYIIINIICLLLFINSNSYSQVVFSPSSTITVNNTGQLMHAPDPVNCTTVARDEVDVKPNSADIDILPGTNSCTTNTIMLDENIICPVVYPLTPVDPNARPIDTGLPVGTTAGIFNVSPQTGAANYNIPIVIPPGTMGMEPSISVTYNSQSGNGLLGYGWNLSGLSAITRVEQDLYNEGKIQGIDFGTATPPSSINDRFALDGNRLVIDYSSPSPYYGSINSWYYTQNETFSKISFLDDGNGSYFKVETKDGKTIRYGYDPNNDCNSRVELGGSASHVLSWLITDITDKWGNYVKFFYNKNSSSNEYWIERIEYSGNSITNAAPYNSVNFYYETRNDINDKYIAGYKLHNDIILRMIKTYSENNLVKTYNFDYSKDANNLYSALNEIEETGSDGSKYNPIIIGQGKAGSVFQLATSNIFENQSVDIYTGDYNNDGYSDLLTVTTGIIDDSDPNGGTLTALNIYFNNKNNDFDYVHPDVIYLPNSYTSVVLDGLVNGTIQNPYNFTFNDFNGDNQEDLLISSNHYGNISGSNNLYRYFDKFKTYSHGYPLSADYLPYSDNNGSYNIIYNDEYLCTGDFDGDGATDIITRLSDTYGYYKTVMYSPKHWQGSNPYSIQASDCYDMPSGHFEKMRAIDFNGDGKSELLVVIDVPGGNGTIIPTTTIYSLSSPSSSGPSTLNYCDIIATPIYTSTTDFFAQQYNGSPLYEILPGDFNGDGKTDFLAYNRQCGSWSIYYSTGTSFVAVPFNFNGYTPSGFNDNYQVKVADYNGDGKTDILVAPNWDVPHIDVYLINGVDFNSSPAVINYTEKSYQSASVGFVPSAPLISGDFNGDGKVDELNNFGIIDMYYFDPNGHESLTTEIADGLNNKTTINYSTLPILANTNLTNFVGTSTTQYNKTPTILPNSGAVDDNVLFIQAPFTVVSSSNTSDGVGGNYTTNYFYEGLLMQPVGLGLMGFSQFTQTKLSQGAQLLGTDILNFNYNDKFSFSNYSSGYCNVYLSQKQSYIGSNLVSTTTETNAVTDFGSHRIFPYTSEEQTVNSETGISPTTNYQYDNAGNMISMTTSTTGQLGTLSKTESYTGWESYGNNGGVANKFTHKSTTNSLAASTITRNYDYSWDNTYGNLKTVTDDYYLVTTTYTPDPNYGVTTNIATTGTDFLDRTVNMEYDATKRFVIKTTNALGQITQKQYDPVTGNVIQSIDENGLATTNSYDGFGRMKETVLPNGKKIEYSINWSLGQIPISNNSNASDAVYYTETDGSDNNMPYVMEYKDVLGRTMSKQTEAFQTSGSNNTPTYIPIYSDNIYNSLGQVAETHTQNLDGTDVKTLYSYDDPYDRVTTVAPQYPLPTITYQYSSSPAPSIGSWVTETNTSANPNQSKTTTTDLTGLVSSVQDPGGTISYTYNAIGKPLTITNSSDGSVTNIKYDDPIGERQMSLTDPNAGKTSYTYWSNGELHTQTDANGNEYSMDYDRLGRLQKKTLVNDFNFPQNNGTYTQYTYDTQPNGIGKIVSISDNTGALQQQFQYDKYGNNNKFTETIPGQNSLVTNYTYNDYGNLTQVTYPGGYSITNSYDNIGDLTAVTSGNNTSIWQLNAMDYMGHVTQYHTANNSIVTNKTFAPFSGSLKEIATGSIFNYLFSFDDATGNLISRSGNKSNLISSSLSETFTYDNLGLNRLSTSTTGNLIINYLDNGNIQNKSDVSSHDYNYNIPPDHPNAVKTIDETGAGVINTLTQTTENYTAFNKISHIGEESGTNDINFTYGVDQERKVMQTVSNSVTTTKYYTRNYEMLTDASGNINKQWSYIPGGDGMAAIYIYDYNTSTGKLYWVAKDHLGSIMGLYDQNGIVTDNGTGTKAEYSYDAWGRRRNPGDWSYTNVPIPTLITRGYTGHEHLDNNALINMNGRLYDPVIGRMLSPDNYVQSPDFTQGFNRYSYCQNNPLRYTDPSGELFGIDDLIVFGVAFILGYSDYDITHHSAKLFNWNAAEAGLANAVVAEGCYLGTGALAGNAAGSMSSALDFSSSFAIKDAITLSENNKQIESAQGWNAVGLIAGYGLASGVSAGFSSDNLGNAIDESFWGDKENFLLNGATSSAIGGALSTGITDFFKDVEKNNSWEINNLKGQELNIFGDMGLNALGSGAGKVVGNYWNARSYYRNLYFNHLSNPIVGTRIANNIFDISGVVGSGMSNLGLSGVMAGLYLNQQNAYYGNVENIILGISKLFW